MNNNRACYFYLQKYFQLWEETVLWFGSGVWLRSKISKVEVQFRNTSHYTVISPKCLLRYGVKDLNLFTWTLDKYVYYLHAAYRRYTDHCTLPGTETNRLLLLYVLTEKEQPSPFYLIIKSWHQDLGLSHPASQWLSNRLATEFSEIITGRYIFLSAFLLPLLINHSLFPKSTWPSSCSFCKMNVLNRFHNFLYNLLFIFY